MDTLIMVSIMTLMLFSPSEPARAATLLVSNEQQTHGDIPVFVTCEPTLRLPKLVPLGQTLSIEIQPPPGDNAVDEKAAASRVNESTFCVGTFYKEAHFGMYERPYVLYNSVKNATECKDTCFVAVKDDGFYRWNNNKKNWHKIPPIIWN